VIRDIILLNSLEVESLNEGYLLKIHLISSHFLTYSFKLENCPNFLPLEGPLRRHGQQK
jgi:hypothetical protein